MAAAVIVMLAVALNVAPLTGLVMLATGAPASGVGVGVGVGAGVGVGVGVGVGAGVGAGMGAGVGVGVGVGAGVPAAAGAMRAMKRSRRVPPQFEVKATNRPSRLMVARGLS